MKKENVIILASSLAVIAILAIVLLRKPKPEQVKETEQERVKREFDEKLSKLSPDQQKGVEAFIKKFGK